MAGARVASEPGSKSSQVNPGPVLRDGERFKDLVGGCSSWPEFKEREQFDVVRLAFDGGRRVSVGSGVDRAEQGEPRQGAVLADPGGEIGIQVRVGLFDTGLRLGRCERG